MTVERYIRIMAGFFVMLSLALGVEGSPIFWTKWALAFTAFVAIRNDGGAHCRDIAPRLREIAAVQELHSVAGEYDFLAKIRTQRARDLEGVLVQIKSIPGVARTTSTVVLNTVFEGQPLKLQP